MNWVGKGIKSCFWSQTSDRTSEEKSKEEKVGNECLRRGKEFVKIAGSAQTLRVCPPRPPRERGAWMKRADAAEGIGSFALKDASFIKMLGAPTFERSRGHRDDPTVSTGRSNVTRRWERAQRRRSHNKQPADSSGTRHQWQVNFWALSTRSVRELSPTRESQFPGSCLPLSLLSPIALPRGRDELLRHWAASLIRGELFGLGGRLTAVNAAGTRLRRAVLRLLLKFNCAEDYGGRYQRYCGPQPSKSVAPGEGSGAGASVCDFMEMSAGEAMKPSIKPRGLTVRHRTAKECGCQVFRQGGKDSQFFVEDSTQSAAN